MASNTGFTSVGDSLITRRMSDVAVCCASASCVSLNSRVFSMAISAWSAKVYSRSICRSEGAGLGHDSKIAPIPTPSCISGAAAISGTRVPEPAT